MTRNDWRCEHACKNSCASLNEALRRETANVRFYESVIDDCRSPQVRRFLQSIVERRRDDMLNIIRKLNEIHANSHITDGVRDSFDD
ncbi:MAG: hypothetical protein GF419_11140 [Ignavibacteriales bacterium]|jgi:rubrerythrin|nr:hypothetical protein [Ignavibacteriales bacterium]